MLETSIPDSVVPKNEGSFFSGLLLGWLLNVAHLGVAFLLFAYGEQTLPTVFVLACGIGLLQIGYVVPIWYVLRRRGRKRMAKGLAAAALATVVANAALWGYIYLNG